MDKYAVRNIKKMQEDALKDVKQRVQDLSTQHTKTASETQELDRLKQQQAELEDALKNTQ